MQVRDVVAAAKKQKPQKPQRRKQRSPKGPVTERIFIDPELDDDDETPAEVMLVPAGRAPAAPPTGSKAAELGESGWFEAAYMLAAAGLVTAARVVLMQQWSDFVEATNRSNQQVLSPLAWPDIAFVALLTGLSEELLFRGGLIPATLPDYRGVLVSGLLFGVLHVTGGRNGAFAVWATLVGWLYGAVFLATSNVWVAAGAHSLANFASAAIWKKGSEQQRL
eukprot:gene6213-6447_t